MRWPLFTLSLLCLLTAPAAAEPTFPYNAYVTADDVFVRSGPGDNYYPTDKLKAGTEVEVYRHDPGGWYAIRPPKDSFSWVSSRHLRLDANGLATVTDDRVAARVGSRMSDIRDVIQVRLKKGETVEVLEPRRNAAGNPQVPWYKIAPPSGEFRWVSGRFVDPDFARDGVRRTSGGRDSTVDLTGQATARLAGQPTPPRRATATQYQKQLDELDLELSTLVVEDPSVWELGELKQRSEVLFNQAETALERSRARMLVGKIARLDDIKRRRMDLPAATKPAVASNRPLSSLLPPGDSDGRYDARGQLIRVPDPKPGGPQYAILDASGNIRCYVSPAPGVNLRSYVGQQVGINGIRGYMPEQRASHVMARRVSVVEGPTLR